MFYQIYPKTTKKFSYTKALSLLFIFSVSSNSMAEGVYFSDMPYYAFKGRTPHVILPLSVEFPIIGNAWRYDALISEVNLGNGNKLWNVPVGYARQYEKSLNIGLFNPLLCYRYDSNAHYFYPSNAAVLTGEDILCSGGTFSGSLMNWATHSTLDLLRYAITGGSRLKDKPSNDFNGASTIVRRANILPVMDHYFNQDAPQKVNYSLVERLQNLRDFQGAKNQMPARYANNHRDEITFSNQLTDVLEVTKDGSHLKGADKPGTFTYKVNVAVCNFDATRPEISDALLRPQYCQKYGNIYKPAGVLQAMDYSRISLLSYLNIGRKLIENVSTGQEKVYKNANPANGTINLNPNILSEIDTRLWGGVVRSPGIFLNSQRYDVGLNFTDNPNMQINANNGILPPQLMASGSEVSINDKIDPLPNKEIKDGGASIINYINDFGYLDGYRNRDMFSELLAESIRYIGNYNAPTSGIRDLNQPGNVKRSPLYFYERLRNNTNLLKYHADDYGFFTNWNWKQMGWDEPVRSVCEKDSVRMITLADSNNWRSTIRLSGGNLSYSSAFGNDNNNTIFKTKRLNSLFTEAGLALTDQVGDLYSPAPPTRTEDVGIMQNRNLSAALLGAANRYGINYQQNGDNKISDVKLKSIVIDVGEPHFNPQDCHLYYAGYLGSGAYPNQKVNKNACLNFLQAAGAEEDKVPTGSPADTAKLLPRGYFFPSEPQQLVQMIYDAFKLPIKIDGTFSAGTLGKYQPAGTQPYVENYKFILNSYTNSRNFQTIESLPRKDLIIRNTQGQLEYQLQPSWGYAVNADLKNANTRNIYLGNQIFNASVINALENSIRPYLKAIPQVFLNASLGFSNDGLSQTNLRNSLIDYLRGNTNPQYENDSMFRKRNSMIGSTQNSTPVYQAKVTSNGHNIVYIGGNNGMLHAINAGNGKEHFSYIPYALLGDVSETAKPSYQNKAMLETHPIVQRVVYDKKNRWLLAGGFGAGNKGIYALDVTKLHTSNAQFNDDDVLFEFTDRDDASVGHIIGQPEFSKIYNQTTKAYQNFLTLTSGYNSVGDMYVYILDIDHFLEGKSKHAGIARDNNDKTLWKEGTNYYKIKIANTNANRKGINLNGFSMVSSSDIAGQTRALYFGDLEGVMYKIDLSNLKAPLSTAKITALRLLKLFNTNNRPITVKPNIALSNQGGVWVVFGTGRYLGLNDLGTKHHTQQSLVAFRDENFPNNRTFTISNLNQFKIEANGNQTLVKTVANPQGWYVDFANSLSAGERMTTYPQIENGTVVFTTQSTGTFGVNSCGDNKGGTGSVNLETGQQQSNFKASNYIVGNVLLLPPLTKAEIDANQQGLDSSQTSVDRAGSNTPMSFITGLTSDQTVNPNIVNTTSGVIRQGTLSWREVSR